MGRDITFIFATRSRIQREEMNGMGNFLKWRDSREWENLSKLRDGWEILNEMQDFSNTIEETHHRTDLCDRVFNELF